MATSSGERGIAGCAAAVLDAIIPPRWAGRVLSGYRSIRRARLACRGSRYRCDLRDRARGCLQRGRRVAGRRAEVLGAPQPTSRFAGWHLTAPAAPQRPRESADSLAGVVHMRIVAPRDRVDDAMELLCATDSVCNVIPECNSDLPERGARLRLTRLPWLSACCRARPSGTRRSGRRRRRPGGRPQPRASRSARLCRELMPSLK